MKPCLPRTTSRYENRERSEGVLEQWGDAWQTLGAPALHYSSTPTLPCPPMKFERLIHASGTVADFYDEALASLGALCERTWHDRLEVVAEGASARLWNDEGALHEVELWFPPPDDTAPREAAREVFPGCPLTFRLAEALRPTPLALDRVVLASHADARPPAVDVAEKLWRAQFSGTNRWQ